jgi:alpha-tubulin suppressor-like RCC1 family protein
MVRWGYGVAAAPVFTLTPTAISGITSISRIFSSAVGTTFALSSTGKLYAWGINTSGNVGNGTITSPVYTPYDVFPAGPNIVDLNNTKFEAATMAIGSDNSVYTWGENTNCGIGDGTTTRRLTPYNVIAAYSANVTTPKIFANSNGGYGVGASHATMYAIKADGTVWSWGDNTFGQVGDGSTTDRCTPYQVLTGVVTGTASDYYSVYIVKADKTIWSWGNNGYGQLGRTGSTTAPGKISLPAIPPLSF